MQYYMKMLLDFYKCESLLEGLVGRCQGGKVSGFEWLVEVVVDYGIHRNEGHVLKELRVGK